ncbi:MAG: LamG-like jellyroll fold domain-containing protein [Xenococcaceae cyanobacterium]
MTLDSNNGASFYVDGEFLEGISGDTPANTSNFPCKIGVGQEDGTQTKIEYWSGNIADVRLWNCVRSHDDIKANMCQRLTGLDSSMSLG